MKGIEQIYNFEDGFFKNAHGKSDILLKKVKKEFDVAEKEGESGKDHPVSIETDFSVLIGEIHPLNEAKETVDNIFAEIGKDFENLLGSKNFDDFIRNFENLFKIEELKKLPGVVRDVIDMEVNLVLSFAAVIENLKILKIENYIENFGGSFNQYFFSKNGYETVSGDLIVRPKLPKIDSEDDLKVIGNQINAERYIRDMTRIIVETSGDSLYKTRDRYEKLKEKYSADEKKNKLVAWFDSFGDMAEASLLPVVEETINGAFGVELNPLIAASIGTFCSVTTRKATEHSYLTLLGI